MLEKGEIRVLTESEGLRGFELLDLAFEVV
jgi:hypothetical protein